MLEMSERDRNILQSVCQCKPVYTVWGKVLEHREVGGSMTEFTEDQTELSNISKYDFEVMRLGGD